MVTWDHATREMVPDLVSLLIMLVKVSIRGISSFWPQDGAQQYGTMSVSSLSLISYQLRRKGLTDFNSTDRVCDSINPICAETYSCYDGTKRVKHQQQFFLS